MNSARRMHVVVPTLGRELLPVVVQGCLEREHLLARLTVVAQRPVCFPADLAALAAQRGVLLDVVRVDGPIGTAPARCLGTERGSEPWVAYLDDDILFDAGSLSRLVETCEREGLLGACGVVTGAEQNTAAYRAFKRLLFRGIFTDPRAVHPQTRGLVSSRVLSGGLTVYRRDAFERCRHTQEHFSGYSWGEDFELSYCVSGLGRVAIDPSVRVRNADTERARTGSPPEVALARLRRYHAFARRTAVRRRDWLHYLGVLVGVLVAGVRAGGGRRIWIAVGRDALATLARLARPAVAPPS